MDFKAPSFITSVHPEVPIDLASEIVITRPIEYRDYVPISKEMIRDELDKLYKKLKKFEMCPNTEHTRAYIAAMVLDTFHCWRSYGWIRERFEWENPEELWPS